MLTFLFFLACAVALFFIGSKFGVFKAKEPKEEPKKFRDGGTKPKVK